MSTYWRNPTEKTNIALTIIELNFSHDEKNNDGDDDGGDGNKATTREEYEDLDEERGEDGASSSPRQTNCVTRAGLRQGDGRYTC